MPRRDRVDNSDRMQACPVCRGTGVVPDPIDLSDTYVCPYCGGLGRVPATGGHQDALHEYRTQVAMGRRVRERAESNRDRLTDTTS